jgi:hypothetical protein
VRNLCATDQIDRGVIAFAVLLNIAPLSVISLHQIHNNKTIRIENQAAQDWFTHERHKARHLPAQSHQPGNFAQNWTLGSANHSPI